MMVVSVERIKPDTLEAAINALPSHPKHMWVSVWRADYSDLTRQLQTLPYLENAQFGFAEANKRTNPIHNVASVQNPTKEMLIGIYRTERLNQQLHVDFHSAEWDYNPARIFYTWNSEKQILTPKDPSRIPPEYPREAGVEYVGDFFRRSIQNSQKRVGIAAAELTGLSFPPPSKVEITPWYVSVSFGREEPSYFPALRSIMERTGRLKVERNVREAI